MTQDTSRDRNSMSFRELLSWQWEETPPGHENAANLLIHIFAVPLFVFAHCLLIGGIFVDSWLFVPAVLGIVLSLILQKIGHSLERNPVIPFAGPRDFVRRFYAEQFCNFWRFLFSGRWYANFKASYRGA